APVQPDSEPPDLTNCAKHSVRQPDGGGEKFGSARVRERREPAARAMFVRFACLLYILTPKNTKNNYSYYKQHIHMYYIYDTIREFCLKRRQISRIQRQTKAVIGDCSDIRPRRARSLRPRPTVPRCP